MSKCCSFVDHSMIPVETKETLRERTGYVWYQTRLVCAKCGFVDFSYTVRYEPERCQLRRPVRRFSIYPWKAS